MQMLDFSDDAVLQIAEGQEGGKNWVFEDTAIPNLQLVVQGGKKTFFYVGPGSEQLCSSGRVGEFPDITVEHAREVAARFNDLAAFKPGRPASVDSPSFVAVAEHFIAQLPLRTHSKSIASDERFIRRNLMDLSRNPFAEAPISEIREHDVAALVRSIANRPAHASAIAVFAKLKTIFKWTMVPPRRQSYGINADPTAFLTLRRLGLQRGFRTRCFDDAETIAYLSAVDLLDAPPHRTLARCLMLRGLPVNKVARMRWAELDLDRMIWRPVGAFNEVEHIPLGRGMAEALIELRDDSSGQPREFVFGSTRDRAPSSANLRKLRRTIVRLMDVELAKNNQVRCPEWQWRDVRRSVLTLMSCLDTSETVRCAAAGLQTKKREKIFNFHRRVRRLLDQHFEALVELRSKDGPYWTAYH